MKDIVRGVSIHSSGTGLQYYVHYDRMGTTEVSIDEYEDALLSLERWKSKVEQSQQKEYALNF